MMNDVIASLAASAVWAMEPRALKRFAENLARAQRAVEENPEMLVQAEAARRGDRERGDGELDVRGGVAHIAISGPMMKDTPWWFDLFGIKATSTDRAREKIISASKSDRVESIQLDIDSPGGTVDGTMALADAVRTVAADIPVKTVADDMMASAAYWVGAQAREIVVGPSAAVGSIGTYAVVDDWSKAFEANGIKAHVVSSGDLKGAFVHGSEITEVQIEDLQRNIDTYTKLFTDAVKEARGFSEKEVKAVATGQVWIGQEAVDKNLADSVAISNADTQQAGARASRDSAAGNAQSVQPTVAPATQTKGPEMDEQAMAELERLRAENTALKQQHDDNVAKAEQEREAQRVALLDQYADRFTPASRDAVRKTLLAFGTHEEAMAYIRELPPVDRADRVSNPHSQDMDVVSDAVAHGVPETIAERSLARVMGRNSAQVREKMALGDAVDYVEHVREQDAQGNAIMVPYAVMKDGSRLTKAEVKKKLGLRMALTCVIAAVFAFGGFLTDAHATALSAARVTTCKSTGAYTKRYLMTASQTIYSGGLVMVTSAGTAQAAAASASNHGVVGVAQHTVTSAASGSYYIRVTQNAICKYAGDTLEQEDVGSVVYADDDQTVDETTGANAPIVGMLVEYVSASVGWVHISPVYHILASIADPLTLSGDLTAGGGAGAVTFSDSASSIVMPDNDSTALDVGSTGLTNLLRFDTTDNAENVTVTGGFKSATYALTAVTTLDASNCGAVGLATAAADGDDITLPAATLGGCQITIVYTGADAGAAIDIEPASGDGIQGICTLAASTVEFAETDDLGITLTKGTSGTGDRITLTADGTADWFVTECGGIWADAAS